MKAEKAVCFDMIMEDAMISNTFIGTPDWSAWLAEIKRTRKLYVKAFAPPQVVLDEAASLKGILVLHADVEATEEVGNTAKNGQVLFWFGDYSPPEVPIKSGIWNAYDVRRNVYMVRPSNAELFTQTELDADPQTLLQRLESTSSAP
jgi:hypothetical protein